MLKRSDMERKLREWNPHWNRQTIEGWSITQLKAIYAKEQSKTVALIRASLGLPN